MVERNNRWSPRSVDGVMSFETLLRRARQSGFFYYWNNKGPRVSSREYDLYKDLMFLLFQLNVRIK